MAPEILRWPRMVAPASRSRADVRRTMVFAPWTTLQGFQRFHCFSVMRADGSPAVLKVQFPHRESEHEAEALLRWNGQGAVRLFAHDPIHRALLLERCEPGDHLSTVNADEALE